LPKSKYRVQNRPQYRRHSPSASTQNQALNALLFLYREVLETPIGYIKGVVRAKRPKRLPVVLSRQEVKAILEFLEGPEWIMAMLMEPDCG
jgi:integrase